MMIQIPKMSFYLNVFLISLCFVTVHSLNATFTPHDPDCDSNFLSTRYSSSCGRKVAHPQIEKCRTWEECLPILSKNISQPTDEAGIQTILIRNDTDKRVGVTPLFFIIGVQKGGTTDLRSRLLAHPAIVGSSVEIHFFDRNYRKIAEDLEKIGKEKAVNNLKINYLENLSNRLLHGNNYSRGDASNIFALTEMRSFVFETTPSYFLVPYVPKRLSSIFPNAKIILMIRDPVDRYFSEAHMTICRSSKPNSKYFNSHFHTPGESSKMIQYFNTHFDPSIEKCMGFARTVLSCEYGGFEASSILRGMYAALLRKWLEYYPPNQIVIVDSNRFFSDPTSVLNEVISFVGLKSFNFRDSDKYKSPAASCRPEKQAIYEEFYRKSQKLGDVKVLREFFKPHNEDFFQLIGHDFGWNNI